MSGSNEYQTLLDELHIIRKECADGHSQTETAIAVFNSQMGTINDQLTQIQGKVDPLVRMIDVHDKDIQDAERDIQNVFGMLGDIKDRVRDVSIAAPVTMSEDSSFWNGPNAKYVFMLAMGFMAILALSMGVATIDDLKDIKP